LWSPEQNGDINAENCPSLIDLHLTAFCLLTALALLPFLHTAADNAALTFHFISISQSDSWWIELPNDHVVHVVILEAEQHPRIDRVGIPADNLDHVEDLLPFEW